MSFREDVFAKIVTYITVAVLLGAMLVEAFVIYRERREQTELEAQVASAQETINDLSAQSHSLTAQVEELQEFQDKWENFVILADNEFCQKMREDLSGRPEVIPEEAVEASLLAEEADALVDGEERMQRIQRLTRKKRSWPPPIFPFRRRTIRSGSCL